MFPRSIMHETEIRIMGRVRAKEAHAKSYEGMDLSLKMAVYVGPFDSQGALMF